MAKIVLRDIVNTYDLTAINDNFSKIETELQDKVLYRNNTSGEVNTLENSIDANGKRIFNLPIPQSPLDAVRLIDLPLQSIGSTSALLTSVIPSGNISSTNVQAALSELDSEKISAASLAASTGASLIGLHDVTFATFIKDRNFRVVDTVAGLRLLDKTKYTKAATVGYTIAGKGSGFYYLDAVDIVSPDNNGAVIVAADGGRWKLINNGRVSAAQFGADSTNTVDAAPRLQQMIYWCQENDVIPCLEPKANYKLLSGLIFNHGQSATDTRKYHPILEGNNATLRPVGTFKALHIVPRCLLADAPTGRGVAVSNITGLEIDGTGATGACQAYVVGVSGYSCDSFKYSNLEVLVNAYTSNNAVHYIECRHISSKLVMRSGTLLIEALAANSFVGDLVFESFEGAGTASSRPLNITAGSGGTNAQARGIRFITPTIYGTGAFLSATGNGQVGDIWFISPQFDGPGSPAGEAALEVFANNTSEIFQIHLTDPYIVNYQGPAVRAQTNDTATLVQCDIIGGGIGLITCSAANGNSAVYALNCEGFDVSNVDFDMITAANAASTYINIDGCVNVRVCDNTGTNSPTIVNAIQIGNGDKHIITDNMMNCSGAVVNDYTGGTPIRLVTNNLKT